ncbi:aldehyde dehydrogenase family protein [Aeromicrobium chenweiae]|uniref:Aldehyde dehydrogenase n=1 Tax=Aeromicrobium chenweiae TaxID=2079793 RepID=A0A2S0WPA1_9ACTN|nr:aldehyde dehydrogenase family protein [Aeromicrobium chenweiae]AWB93168.1 aldehyde dehydrogenase [Aeromicrobium chenweiae]TGN34158.1 aldehyde dehydrogenase family protein [Aeromicrobium chenweiae]
MTHTELTTARNFVGGEWAGSRSDKTFDRHNPAHLDEHVVTAPDSTSADVEEAVGHVSENYHAWADTAPEVRADVLIRAADILAQRADDIAEELVREEGKTLAEARMETRRTPQNLRYYAGESLRLTGSTYPTADGSWVLTSRSPVGVVAAITPWNFPLNIPSRKLGPALAAGNGVVFKPSEVTPLSGQRLVEALVEAGVPGGALALVHGHGEVGRAMVSDPRVAAVTFTGSTAVGEAIHSAVSVSVRCQLEMGGKNAFVVLEDADLDKAADIIAKGAFGLSGQACTGTSRVVVHESVADCVLDRVLERAQAHVVGDGLVAGTTMGPLANRAQWDKYQEFLQDRSGARLETPLREQKLTDGYYARPAIFTSVGPTDRLAQEEIFGPVLSFLTVGSYDEAVDVVNGTPYGLSAGIATRDMGRAMQFSRDVEAGVVKVNQATTGMAMNAPFGGVKMSSTQTHKEQAGDTMMHFYTTDKTIYISA